MFSNGSLRGKRKVGKLDFVHHRRQLITTLLLGATVAAITCLVLFAAYGFLGRSDFFQITSITIEGNRILDRQEILKLSGIDIHSNLVTVRNPKVRERLKKNEWIEDVTLKKNWPDQLIIEVRERKPVALLNTSKELFYLDRRGNPFAPHTAGQEIDFPIITGIPERWIARRQKDNPDSPLMRAMAFIKRAGNKNSILPAQRISEIHIGADNSLSLHLLDRPFPIILGQGDSTGPLLRRLVYVLRDLDNNHEFDRTASITMDYAPDKVLVSSRNEEQIN